ncbi:MAG: carbohydrate ABC transporter permease [Gammaproteobacteria bacterium]|nr:carbohydrate ABC transporter permease [Gammaproteobacteria bacterium]
MEISQGANKNNIISLLRNFALVLYGALILGPFLFAIFVSLKTTAELYQNPFGLPSKLHIENYAKIFYEGKMPIYFGNSFFVTLISVGLIVLCSSLCAYAIIMLKGWRGNAFYVFFTLGMMIPTQVNMVPLYLLIVKMGLNDTRIGLVLAYVAFGMPFAIFIMVGFMRGIPWSLIEASKIDGAKEWQIYLRIVLPLSLPSFATVAIFNFVWVWNDLLFPLLFVRLDSVKTLPLAMLRFQGEYSYNFPMFFAGVILVSIPMVITYLLLQRWFITGLTAGANKG